MYEASETAHLDAEGAPRIIVRRFVVADEQAGMRLDRYLQHKIPRLSRNKLQEVIRTQLEATSGRSSAPPGLKPATIVHAGDEIVLRRPAKPEPRCRRDLTLVATDPSFYVFDKPARLPMHASARFYFNTVTRILRDSYPDEGLQIAHRLDRETSGCLVVARGLAASSVLKQAFEKRRIAKVYTALVHGAPPWISPVRLDAPLRLATGDEGMSIRMVTAPDGAPSVTRVQLARAGHAASLVTCWPVTGRQHQIRAHLALAGYPIVGDKLYAHGDEAFRHFCRLEEEGASDAELERLFHMVRHGLHASEITFPHPVSGAPVTARAPLPAELSQHPLLRP